MKEFIEKVGILKKGLQDMLTKDSPKELVDKITNLDSMVDEVVKSHNATETELTGIKEDYIKLIKKSSVAEEEKNNMGNLGRDDLNVNDNFKELLDGFHKDYVRDNK